MAIPSRQIGWSTKANLLWQISKQLERLTCVTAGGCGTTTTTTTIVPTTTTTTPICVDFINSIVISNGSYALANGTYTRDNASGAFTNENGSIFFGGDAWYIFNTAIGNVARNTSTLGTGIWEPWAPGNSSGITAEYSSYICPTTTTTTTAIACECLTFVNEDGNLCFIGFTDCNGEPVETEILANETLQFCGCCGYADSELVFITVGDDCIGGLCPGISTTTTTTTADPTQCNYTIGQAALGGKIAYILQPEDPGYDSNLQQGLVATVADISQGATWGCNGTLISGADGTAIGTGNQNTIDIMAGCATSSIAARLCGDLIEGGYSDWYLPSKDELNKLYLNRVAIGGFQLDVSGIYWSSTEFDNNNAWIQSFYNSATNGFGKEYPLYVRAIRAFTCTIPN